MNEERLKEYSLKRCQELLVRHGLEVRDDNCIVREGNVVRQITKQVNKSGVDMVIMGTRGETDHKLFWIGSVASEVLSRVKCPVLAIPGSCTYNKIEKIMYTTDLSYFENHILKEVSSLAEKLSAQLVLLHIINENHDLESLEVKMEKLKKDIDYLNVKTQFIEAEDMVEGINDYVKLQEVDVLAMCTHTKSVFQKLFHQSLATKMVFNSDIPILVYCAEVHPIVFT